LKPQELIWKPDHQEFLSSLNWISRMNKLEIGSNSL